MKKRPRNEPLKKVPKTSRIFNSVNIILIALLFVELVFIANWVTTGNQVKSVSLGSEASNSIFSTQTSDVDLQGAIYLSQPPYLLNNIIEIDAVVHNSGTSSSGNVLIYLYTYLPNGTSQLLINETTTNIGPGRFGFIKDYSLTLDNVGDYLLELSVLTDEDSNLSNNYENRTFTTGRLINTTFNAKNSQGIYVDRGVYASYGWYLATPWIKTNSSELNLTLPTPLIDLRIASNFSIFDPNNPVSSGENIEGPDIVFFGDSQTSESMNLISESYKNYVSYDNLTIYRVFANKPDWAYKKLVSYSYINTNDPLMTHFNSLRIYLCPYWDFASMRCIGRWLPGLMDEYSKSVEGDWGYIISSNSGNYEAFALGEPYTCADLNHDGLRDVLDVTLLVNHAFRGGPEPQPKWIGDLNGDGIIDVFDVVHMVNHVFRGYPEPTCTVSPIVTSSSATASLGSPTGTTTKTIPVNLANTENVAGTTFKISYDSLKASLKNVRTATRTSNMNVIRNGNTFTLISQNGATNIPKGTGAVAYLDFVAGKSGFDTSSLKITEVKATNIDAKKISVKISSSSLTNVKSGTNLV